MQLKWQRVAAAGKEFYLLAKRAGCRPKALGETPDPFSTQGKDAIKKVKDVKATEDTKGFCSAMCCHCHASSMD